MGVLLYFLLILSQQCLAWAPETEQLSEMIDKLISLANSKSTKESAKQSDEMKMAKPMNDSNVIYFKATPTDSDNIASKSNNPEDHSLGIGGIDNLLLGKSPVSDDKINDEDRIEIPQQSRRMMSTLGKIDPNENMSERRLVDFALERLANLNPLATTLKSPYIPKIVEPQTIELNNADQDFSNLFKDVERLLKEVTDGKVSQRNGDNENVFYSTPLDFRSAKPYIPLLGNQEAKIMPGIGTPNMSLNRPCRSCRRIPKALAEYLRLILRNQNMIQSLRQKKILADGIKNMRTMLAMKNLRRYF